MRTSATNTTWVANLREAVTRLCKPERVDRDKGVLYGVKILGLESLNGRRYTLEACRKAAPLYEGCAVNVDHPDRPQETRSAYDRFGWLEAVRVREDGLYGDLHLLDPTDPLARKLLKAAEERPDVYGLSHNASGSGQAVEGVDVIETITEVRSVDLVAEPATTKGLFEHDQRNRSDRSNHRSNHRRGKRPMKTVKQVLEAAFPKAPKGQQKVLKALLEDDTLAPALAPDMDEPAEEGDWRKQLADVVGSLVSSEDPASHEMARKILAMLKPETAAATDTEEAEGEDDGEKDMEEAEDGEDDGKGDKKTEESRQRSKGKSGGKGAGDAAVKLLREELAVRDLVEEAGLKFSKPEHRKAFVLSLVPLTEAERKALIEDRQALTEAVAAERPRSRAPDSTGGAGGNGSKSKAPLKFPADLQEARRNFMAAN